jgi:hypothetical protein
MRTSILKYTIATIVSSHKNMVLGSCFDYFVSKSKSFLHAILYIICSHLAILKVFSKLYISIHHEFAQGMYNYHFCNDFAINSSHFDVYKDLMFWFSCNREES